METQWDHPAMMDIIQNLEECNEIRFPAYRTACKLGKVQRAVFCKFCTHITQMLRLFAVSFLLLNVYHIVCA